MHKKITTKCKKQIVDISQNYIFLEKHIVFKYVLCYIKIRRYNLSANLLTACKQ